MSLLAERRALTKADLDTLPDDGHRYELIDGSLIVTPARTRWHQLAGSGLLQCLYAACPQHLIVLTAPTDVTLGANTTLQPDALVVERSRFADESNDLRPVLVVEILSPSTRQIDLTLKKSQDEAAGCPAYWVVDHEVPSITAWTLTNGAYADPQIVVGAEPLTTETPFALTMSPDQLTL